MLDVRWRPFNKPLVVFNPRLNSTPLRRKSTRWQGELSEYTIGYVRVRTVQNSTVSENYKRCIWPVVMHRRIKDGKVQTAIILNCAGRQVLEVYDNIARESDDDKHNADKVLRALENHCNPRDNEALESHRFLHIQNQEPFDKIPDETQKEISVLQLSRESQNEER